MSLDRDPPSQIEEVPRSYFTHCMRGHSYRPLHPNLVDGLTENLALSVMNHWWSFFCFIPRPSYSFLSFELNEYCPLFLTYIHACPYYYHTSYRMMRDPSGFTRAS